MAVLVEDQFGLVYFSCDYNLVNKICAYSADALCRLSLSNYFVIGDSFALLSLDEMLLILLYLDLLIFIRSFFGGNGSGVHFHDVSYDLLVTYSSIELMIVCRGSRTCFIKAKHVK